MEVGRGVFQQREKLGQTEVSDLQRDSRDGCLERSCQDVQLPGVSTVNVYMTTRAGCPKIRVTATPVYKTNIHCTEKLNAGRIPDCEIVRLKANTTWLPRSDLCR